MIVYSNNSGSNSTSTSTNSKSPAPSNSRQLARSRARLMRPSNRSNSGTQGSGSRSTGVIIAGGSSSRPLVTVPATYVPEELISQAEVVLQGKSRNLIIRELQVRILEKILILLLFLFCFHDIGILHDDIFVLSPLV